MPYIPDTSGAAIRALSNHNLNWDDLTSRTSGPVVLDDDDDTFVLTLITDDTPNIVFDPPTTSNTPPLSELSSFLDFSFELPSIPSLTSLLTTAGIMDTSTTTLILDDDAGNIIAEIDETLVIPDGMGDVVVLETKTIEFDSLSPGTDTRGGEEALMRELEAMLEATGRGDGVMMAGGLGPVMVGVEDADMIKVFEIEGETRTVEVSRGAGGGRGRGRLDGYDAVIAIVVQLVFLIVIWGVVMGIRNQIVRYRGYEKVKVLEVPQEGVTVVRYRDEEEGEIEEGEVKERGAKGEKGSPEEREGLCP